MGGGLIASSGKEISRKAPLMGCAEYSRLFRKSMACFWFSLKLGCNVRRVGGGEPVKFALHSRS